MVKLNASIGSPHPDCRKGEMFICYANEPGFKQIGWNTKRKGVTVINDDEIDMTNDPEHEDIFPVFVQKAEFKERFWGYTAAARAS